MSPPSLPVTTAHAVAVGHIMHSMKASIPSRSGICGTKCSNKASRANEPHCTSSR